MSEFINRRKSNFTQISNLLLLNNNLSLKAKGFLCIMLSRPDGWTYRMKWLEIQSKDGREATQSALKELVVARYVIRKARLGQDGKLNGWVYWVSDEPFENADFPSDGKAVRRESRQAEKPSDISNTDSSNTDSSNTEKKESKIVATRSKKSKDLSVSASAAPDASPKKSLLEMLTVWNTLCGTLPKAEKLTKTREAGLKKALLESGEDFLKDFTDAVTEVSSDDWWVKNGYGLDNLLRSGVVISKAEKCREKTSGKESKAEMHLEIGSAAAKTLAASVDAGSRWEAATGLVVIVADSFDGFVYLENGEAIWQTDFLASHTLEAAK